MPLSDCTIFPTHRIMRRPSVFQKLESLSPPLQLLTHYQFASLSYQNCCESDHHLSPTTDTTFDNLNLGRHTAAIFHMARYFLFTEDDNSTGTPNQQQ